MIIIVKKKAIATINRVKANAKNKIKTIVKMKI